MRRARGDDLESSFPSAVSAPQDSAKQDGREVIHWVFWKFTKGKIHKHLWINVLARACLLGRSLEDSQEGPDASHKPPEREQNLTWEAGSESEDVVMLWPWPPPFQAPERHPASDMGPDLRTNLDPTVALGRQVA